MVSNDHNDMSRPEGPEKDELPSEISEMLEGVPETRRQEIARVMEAQFSMISRVSPEMEISKKVNADHITKALENQNKAMDLQHKDQWQRMIFYCFLVIILLVGGLGVIQLLKDIPDTMERILTTIVAAVISGFGGYGIGYKKGSREDH